ncbi:hypothetical protein OIU76_007860 [Salix suchowensis]|nr:hypothetical protein OIU76_007860 [Salix suchowensis]
MVSLPYSSTFTVPSQIDQPFVVFPSNRTTAVASRQLTDDSLFHNSL